MRKEARLNIEVIRSSLESKGVDITSESQFQPVSLTISNFRIIVKTLNNHSRNAFILKNLIKFEREFKGFGKHNSDNFIPERDIPALYKRSCELFGLVPQPKNDTDIKRWAFLICVSVAIINEFSYGNIIVPSIDINLNKKSNDNQ